MKKRVKDTQEYKSDSIMSDSYHKHLNSTWYLQGNDTKMEYTSGTVKEIYRFNIFLPLLAFYGYYHPEATHLR